MRKTLLLAAVLASAAAPAFAADYTDDATEASRSGAHGWTVYVDVTFGLRKRVAAAELVQAHRAFSDQGFEPVAVTPHEENGDLQGFFVTYRRF
jgi:opacity protein-like surface antigen